jgi:hypothetical protein
LKNHLINKLSTKIESEGLVGLLKWIIDRLVVNTRNSWRMTFRNKNHIYTLKKPTSDTKLPFNIRIEHYTKTSDMPSNTISQLEEEMGQHVINWLDREFEQSATLWVGYIDDEYVVRQWTRFGMHFDKWFIELNDNDYVFFASGTIPKWRGNGLMPKLGNYIMRDPSYLEGNAYVDIKIWNSAAINARKKNGAKYVATMKPYL